MNMDDFEDPTQLIKTATKVIRYDDNSRLSGVEHDMYYDRKADQFIIADFPYEGHTFDMSVRPETGFAELGINDDIYKVKIYEQ